MRRARARCAGEEAGVKAGVEAGVKAGVEVGAKAKARVWKRTGELNGGRTSRDPAGRMCRVQAAIQGLVVGRCTGEALGVGGADDELTSWRASGPESV